MAIISTLISLEQEAKGYQQMDMQGKDPSFENKFHDHKASR